MNWARHDYYGDEEYGELIIFKDLRNDVGVFPSEEHNRLTQIYIDAESKLN